MSPPSFDHADFADLARLWPDGVGGGARRWLVDNIPVGIARNAHVDLGLTAPADLSSLVLTRATGTLDGDGLQVYWLRPVPPIENGQAQLRFIDPDTLEIIVSGGRQRLRGQSAGGLQIRSGRMRIAGIMQPHQTGAIDAEVTGSLPDAITLLREPRLGLLDRHPIELKNPAGQMSTKVNLTLPLEDTVRMDDIAIQAQAHLEGVHLGAVAAGHDLDQGTFDLTANPESMKLGGRAQLASIPAKLDVAMDFRAGPATQVVQSITVAAQPDARQLAAVGLDATSLMNGPAQLQLVLNERRNGQGDLAVTADLTGAELAVAALEWRKPRDAAAKASARVLLDHDRLTGIEAVQLDGEGVVLRGRGDFSAGRLSLFTMDRLVLGRTSAHGTLTLPLGGPIVANVSGATLDLAPRLGRKTPPQPASRSKAEPPPGPPWTLDARFDRVLMARGRISSDVVVHVENDGRVVQQLRLDGRTGPQTAFAVQLVPDRAGRRLTARAADAGELLRSLDYVRSMQGGRLSVQAQYEDTQPGRPLSGSAEINDFRINDAPALAKLLQAMTLYGLVEAMQGSGLGFTRLVAPFRLTDDALELNDARAFSSSLGLTMKGRLDLGADGWTCRAPSCRRISSIRCSATFPSSASCSARSGVAACSPRATRCAAAWTTRRFRSTR